MEEKKKNYYAWIDRANGIVSFRKVEGFEQLEFSTHDEMFRYVIEKSVSGFRIQ